MSPMALISSQLLTTSLSALVTRYISSPVAAPVLTPYGSQVLNVHLLLRREVLVRAL